jgi:hypothetical protein
LLTRFSFSFSFSSFFFFQAPANSSNSIAERQKKLRRQLETDLGAVEFAAAYRLLLLRYRRLERDESTPADDEKVVQAKLRTLLGRNADKREEIEQLVLMEEGLGF